MLQYSQLNDRLEELFRKEKQRRGESENSLVFIATTDVGRVHSGTEESILKNRTMEFNYFSAYLKDRISYALRLGYIKELPGSDEDILRVGEEITIIDINHLLKEQELNRRRSQLLLSRAEQYPSMRWNFEWDKYVVIGAPDGITDEFVYMFKTTKNRSLMRFVKPVALTQGDLYGYFFQRKDKRVQIHVAEDGITETYEGNVDKNRAEKALKYFRMIDNLGIP